jgi:hypothetical protein
MRFGCSSECYRCRRTEPIGLARSRLDVAVSSSTRAVFRSTPAPGHLRFRVHPLLNLPPLQSTTRCTPARPLSRSCAFPGVLSSFATSASRIHLPAGIPLPAYVPPSAFLALSTVYSSRCLAGLFHPTAVSEVHSSGVFPDRQPTWLVARPFPLDVSSARLHRASSVRQLASLVFRALIQPSVRCSRRVV